MGEWTYVNAANWLYYLTDVGGAKRPYGYALCRRSDDLDAPLWDAVIFRWTDLSTTILEGVSLEEAKAAIEEHAALA